MAIPQLYHEGRGRERIGDDTPVYYASEKGEEVAVWFQRPFENYSGYSMQDSLFKRMRRRDVDTVYIVDFMNKTMAKCHFDALKYPEKIILKNDMSTDELSEYEGFTMSGKILPDVIIEPNSDTKDPQRLVTVDQLTMVERNLEYYRDGGESYRELVLADIGED